jgi:hypothetical protein
MLRDPFTGTIDFEEVARYAILIGIFCAVISAGAASEGLGALYPYEYVANYLLYDHPTVTIAAFMVMLMALWWYEQFRGGYF